MPSIKDAVRMNEARRAAGGPKGLGPLQGPTLAPNPGMPSRTALPTRGSYPPSVILDTDFTSATSFYYGRLRARTLLPPPSKNR